MEMYTLKRRPCKNHMESLRYINETVVLRIPELYNENAQQLSVPTTPAACGELLRTENWSRPFPSIGL